MLARQIPLSLELHPQPYFSDRVLYFAPSPPDLHLPRSWIRGREPLHLIVFLDFIFLSVSWG
jgi:hypothetical protein